jgi:hypothetical protein
MDFKARKYEGVDWIDLALDWEHRRILVKAVVSRLVL